ncbi:hypothetical protein D477_006828 [Arthrobacter crystallopoietes BAB-32]|uniref:Transmembrane protein (PGPGW) n=1 Tax=Arthrobacter crystallopoietes BAB-32 TaxID=1246476 RepID=N1V0Y2_9MICC|nr:PGPGW domain-containing protein [Arthrobacter crystallopoietes]EMY34990.1 hypothetical protein D477_006828 [Arthrobacter crystallopoietes BAB-32]
MPANQARIHGFSCLLASEPILPLRLPWEDEVMGNRLDAIPPWLRRVGIELLGWLLIVVGIAALVLPGPGLLAIAGGLVVLSVHYVWAKHLLVPIKVQALRIAAKEVQTWPRIIAGAFGGCGLIAAGAVWAASPPMPGWWPFGEQWWLPGGRVAGLTLIASGLIALLLLAYCFHRFRLRGTAWRRRRSTPRRRR